MGNYTSNSRYYKQPEGYVPYVMIGQLAGAVGYTDNFSTKG